MKPTRHRWGARRRRLALAVVVLGLAALRPGRAGAAELQFEVLDQRHGLSHRTVNAIAQDGAGFIWVGTADGLCRYDAYALRCYNGAPAERASLSDNWVASLHVDRRGRLWVGTLNGLQWYDPDQDRFVRVALGGGARHRINAMLSDAANNLWLATSAGLLRIAADGSVLRRVHAEHVPASLASDDVRALALDGDGRLWIGTARGLERLAAPAAPFEHIDATSGAVDSLWIEPSGTVWLGGEWGLARGHGAAGGRWTAAPLRPPVRLAGVHALAGGADGTVWVGSRHGLFRGGPGAGLEQVHGQPGSGGLLPTTYVLALLADRSGTLWVGSEVGGVSHASVFSGGITRFQHRPADPASLGDDRIIGIGGAAGGRLWVSTYSGLNLFDPASGKATVLRAGRGGPHTDVIRSTCLAPDGVLWVGTGSGLVRFDGRRFARLPAPPGGPPGSDEVRQIDCAAGAALWLATEGGLRRLARADGAAAVYPQRDGDRHSLSHNRVFSMARDGDGRLWVGTFEGLNRFDPGSARFERYYAGAAADSLSNDRIFSLLRDRSGTLWAGTADGLNRIDVDRAGRVRIARADGLRGSGAGRITAMLEGEPGQLWLSTGAGLLRYDVAERSVLALGAAADGGGAFVGSAFRAADGMLYFGGIKGITRVDPAAARANPAPPPVAITDLRIDNRSMLGAQLASGLRLPYRLAPGASLQLSHLDNRFALEFTALHFSASGRNRFAYRLDGVDRDWVPADAGRRVAAYTNLDPGSYVFRVRAANSDGVWNHDGATLTIHIAPPFWRTAWFRAAAAALAAALLWGGYRLRIRKLVQQRAALEQQVRERTADAFAQQQEAERQRAAALQQAEVAGQAHRNIARLSEMGRQLGATLERSDVLRNACRQVGRLMEVAQFEVARPAAPAGPLVLVCRVVHGLAQHEAAGHQLAPGDPMAACLAGGEPVFTPSALYAPLLTEGRTLGVLAVRREHGAYRQVDLDMLATLAAHLAVALDNADAYRQLKDAQQQLVFNEKMAALGTLTAGIAHEINNPANFAHVGAQALQLDVERFRQCLLELAGQQSDRAVLDLLNGGCDAIVAQLGTIVAGTSRIRDLVKDMRSFSRVDAAERKKVAIADCLRLNIHLVRAQFALNVEFVCRLDPAIEVDCSPAQINHVFMNLLINACQAIEARQRSGTLCGPGRVQIDGQVEHGQLVLSIADNGCGIAPALLDRVCEPFFTTREVGAGSGLGLSVAFGIVERHHGTLRIASVEGEGTTVVLRLPLAAP